MTLSEICGRRAPLRVTRSRGSLFISWFDTVIPLALSKLWMCISLVNDHTFSFCLRWHDVHQTENVPKKVKPNYYSPAFVCVIHFHNWLKILQNSQTRLVSTNPFEHLQDSECCMLVYLTGQSASCACTLSAHFTAFCESLVWLPLLHDYLILPN